ncbi:jg14696 [Pararge aegeria aegeria]|uniref:Jg14696 protein n=1 Tax=Pararge aegeria aegeria TaxID=348720 RepID=A0A8S4SNJ6_9NEOP|nr:jg14696 [Pararge aegeria aegeria]
MLNLEIFYNTTAASQILKQYPTKPILNLNLIRFPYPDVSPALSTEYRINEYESNPNEITPIPNGVPKELNHSFYAPIIGQLWG